MRIRRIAVVGILFVIIGAQLAVYRLAMAEAQNAPELVMSEFKVTSGDGQFFTLYNPSATTSIQLDNYELEYFNSNDRTKATSSKILPLSGALAPQSYYMLSDGSATICYRMTVNTVSLGFSTTAGMAELVRLPENAPADTPIVPAVVDYVSWSKHTSKGNDVLDVSNETGPLTVASGTSVTWLRQLPVTVTGAGTWQPVRPDPADLCSLQLISQSGGASRQAIGNLGGQLGAGQQPPVTIVNLAASDSDVSSLPAADIGLAAPQLTELLPNPLGTGTDGTDEFIELYNPNAVEFDLTGFTLQTGATTKHSYVFPDGTMLPSGSFTAFYSSDTGLSLSNTSGQADLLDPFGNTISQTDVYGSAKDGQTWALANGKWYWTSVITPNAPNVIKQSTSQKTSTKTSGTSGSSVKGASTTDGNGYGGAASVAQTTPIHPAVLAAVVVVAVGYGVYEYRHDIADRIHEFRRNRKSGRAART